MDICQIATKVISGEQALAAFRVYRTERIFILCDSFLTQSGAIDLLSRQIAPTNQVQVFDDVVPDPNLSGVARAMPAGFRVITSRCITSPYPAPARRPV